MRVHIGTDHAGFELKQHLVEHLRGLGHDVVDHGAPVYEATDDYPPYVLRAAAAVAAEPGSLGIVLGGSGNGEQIAANAVPGIRAALAWSVETARLAREHNDAQVVGIGARMHSAEEAAAIAEAFVATPFSGEDRHRRRIEMLTEYAATGELPPLPA
ncbi:ribose-5-phosphate isomerase [Kineococcus sp. SYSU DK004]|uniref:ribose-5-phosphate isomerase n=1 Tax=Kineococcus sp. SYSU DK004 TaxID=3383125 RepID=UPI003D7ED052